MGKKKVEEETYEVEAIIDARGTGKKREYKVKWVGYSAKQSTWEPIAHLSGVKDVKRRPRALGSARRLRAARACERARLGILRPRLTCPPRRADDRRV